MQYDDINRQLVHCTFTTYYTSQITNVPQIHKNFENKTQPTILQHIYNIRLLMETVRDYTWKTNNKSDSMNLYNLIHQSIFALY